jgi:hypothetical protein
VLFLAGCVGADGHCGLGPVWSDDVRR